MAVSSPPISILVVDDDPEVREILVESLEVYGYAVIQAASGEIALERLAANSGVRLLISDVRMPGISGLELLERARQASPDLKFILISGYFLPQPIQHRFLKKPFHMRDLAAAVAEELGTEPVPN